MVRKSNPSDTAKSINFAQGPGDKASRCVGLLDAARTQGSWNEVPELVKKLKKHAPQRKVLADVANAEVFVTKSDSREPTPASQEHTPLNALGDVLQTDHVHSEEDALQGKTCLLWASWVGLTSVPLSIQRDEFLANMRVLKDKETSVWTKICMVKGAYIQGVSSQRDRQTTAAKEFFMIGVDLIQSNRELIASTPQLAYWSEQLLAQLALISPDDDKVEPKATNALRLQVFRNWVYVVSWAKESPASSFRNSSAHMSRMVIWRNYYQHLSLLLRETSQRQVGADPEERWQLATELRKVESLYETEMLRVHKFPKASQSNTPIEDFVEQVISNWQILCGPQWRDTELGEGGRNAIGHNVLDILYRAATKIFHSTLILRRLFQVHKSLTEFDLAYRCLDTYIELVERAKARAAKSATPASGVESTETFLATIAEGVEGLSSFGGQNEARRAHELCIKINNSLRQIEGQNTNGTQVNGDAHKPHRESATRTIISSKSMESIYRALGVGTAHWSRWTSLSEQRTQLQEDAIEYLNKACSQRSVDEVQIETRYASALVLAESRDIAEAIVHIKLALNTTSLSSPDELFWTTERQSIALWHLLALLLSSRHEFDLASKSCHAAFEQFPSSTVFVGATNMSSSGFAEKSHVGPNAGIIHDMECRELQKIVEIRITELALTELKDGPEDAVNASNELLSTFSQLFAHLDLDTSDSSLAPAKTPAATLKSVKGSIFSRKKNRQSVVPDEKGRSPPSVVTETTRPSTQTTEAPTIQVTDEHGKSPQHKRHRIRDSLERRNDGKSSHETPRKLTRRPSQKSTQNASQVNVAAETAISADHDTSLEAKQPLPEVKHNLGSHNTVPPPTSHDDQPPQQDVRLPTVHPFTSATSPPTPRFSKNADQRHALSILVKIWLVIAKLYRRASMYEDSREACEEAAKAVSRIEDIVGAIDHSARAFAQAGWGGTGQSVDQMWADVYFERAELLLATYQRRQLEGHHALEDDLRKTVEQYEQCLMLHPDHAGGIIGLSNVLLDYYERKVDLSRLMDDGKSKLMDRRISSLAPSASAATTAAATVVVTSASSETQSLDGIPGSFEIPAPLTNGVLASAQASARPSVSAVDDRRIKPDDALKKTPENLIRIAARDRAYGLLSSLTKSGSGWDNSEAWYALSRAHELSGEIEKARSVLWWCVELEDTKPIRHWRNLGYVLD